MTKRTARAVLLGVAGMVAIGLLRPIAAQAPKLGTVERITVHGRSLEGNLIGDSADRTVIVYLPPSYATNTTQRYPVVYLLHGYGLRVERWMTLFHIEAGANTATTGVGGGVGTGNRVREMIIVNPDAYSFYDGSFYSNSPVTGDWETFIATDLVDYIDAHYRTLARRESRGLAGHSMGGYGTFRIAMKRPDVFGAMYALSACCAMDKGDPGEQMTAAGTYTTREEVAALRYPNKGTLARAAAWSPNAAAPPLFVDLPVRNGMARPEIQAKWIANSIVPMLAAYGDNLRRYRGVRFDVGTSDNLLAANKQVDAAMFAAKIPHQFVTYPGDHNSRIAERIETEVLPFFSFTLAFD
ncbi:MAG TPA: alpha/beta fold hydrolase [Vicinamibacterales bacterium]|nr:alpha/beta fold hydrolase [Vicinamibacterales bacterium]